MKDLTNNQINRIKKAADSVNIDVGYVIPKAEYIQAYDEGSESLFNITFSNEFYLAEVGLKHNFDFEYVIFYKKFYRSEAKCMCLQEVGFVKF